MESISQSHENSTATLRGRLMACHLSLNVGGTPLLGAVALVQARVEGLR